MDPADPVESQNTIYYLDERDIIVDVNGDWNEFAQRNGGILLAEEVVGKPLARFIAGEPTQMYISVVLEGVRSLKRGCVRSYRCDSPDQLRFMEMSVEPDAGNLVRLEHRCLRVEPRTPNVMFNYRPGAQAIRCCSICNRIEHKGDWVEAHHRIVGTQAALLDVAYEVCRNCLSSVR